MELAKMGLGLKEIVFNLDGDAKHVHSSLLAKFPALDTCGGYTLLRLLGNAKHLIEVESPDGGMTVVYLNDILNQAKLYIRSLQSDITPEMMKPYISEVNAVVFDYVLQLIDVGRGCPAVGALSKV